MSDNWIDSEGTFLRPFSCKMHWNVTFSSPATTFFKIATVSSTNCLQDYDTSPSSNMFNQSSQRIDIQRTGIYRIITKSYQASASNVKNWEVLNVNGSRVRRMAGTLAGFTASNVMRMADTFIELTSGDNIEFFVHLGTTAGLTVGSTNSELWNTFAAIYQGDI